MNTIWKLYEASGTTPVTVYDLGVGVQAANIRAAKNVNPIDFFIIIFDFNFIENL